VSWRRRCLLILSLLTVWATATFVPAWFARDLSFSIAGWPFPFWMAAYGAPLLYLGIVVFFAAVMNREEE
jgi:putative solute:sodium symporter small subunit